MAYYSPPRAGNNTLSKGETKLNGIEKAYLPMTETMYYILLSLTEPRHGYGIILHVRQITSKRVSLTPGTVYNSLAKLLRDGLILPAGGEERRKPYLASDTGKSLLKMEVARLKELYLNGEAAIRKE